MLNAKFYHLMTIFLLSLCYAIEWGKFCAAIGVIECDGGAKREPFRARFAFALASTVDRANNTYIIPE